MPLSLKSRLARTVRTKLGIERRRWRQRAYSQEGEDLILARYFADRRPGFYVDIGAHHPFLISNTQLFHERGWRGINVDAMPGSMEPFHYHRPGDINLELGVGTAEGDCTYFVFNEPALNTFDEATALARDIPPCRIVERIVRPVVPLARILEEHLPPDTPIDFLSIDAEGRDLDVLHSNDWSRFVPRVVLAEVYGTLFDEVSEHPVTAFLMERGYAVLAKTVNTAIYVRSEEAKSCPPRSIPFTPFPSAS